MSDVNRWHCSPHMALRNSGDTVLLHSRRLKDHLFFLCLYIDEPFTKDLADYAERHDLPELIMGDWPATLTRKYRLASIFKAIIEWQVCRDMGLKMPRLSAKQKLMFCLCDSLDAYLWARLKLSTGVFNQGFENDLVILNNLAAKIGPKAQEWLEYKLT